MHVWVHVYMKTRGQPQEMTTLFFDRVSGTWGLLIRLGWWAIELKVSACVQTPVLGLQVCIITFYMGAGDPTQVLMFV